MSASVLESGVSTITADTTHRDRMFVIRVPGSTSNLGAGFDSVGMAIGRWLEVTARVNETSDESTIRRSGTLASLDVPLKDDLIWRGFVAACVALRRTPPDGVTLDATSDIPVARGLGSSASAIIAGVLLANTLFDGGLDEAAIIDIAASLEGHPDNVAPSVLGGAVLTVQTAGHHYHSARLWVHHSLRFVFLVPDFEVKTATARAALPAEVSFETSVRAASRAGALVVGLQSGDSAILRLALDDVLHVPYRRSLIAGYDAVIDAAIAAGAIGATISGSGSTIVAVTHREGESRVRAAAQRAWADAGVTAETFVAGAAPRGATIDTVPRTEPRNEASAKF